MGNFSVKLKGVDSNFHTVEPRLNPLGPQYTYIMTVNSLLNQIKLVYGRVHLITAHAVILEYFNIKE